MQITTKPTENMTRREEQKLEQLLLEGVRSDRGPEIGSDEWRKFRKHLSEAKRGQPHKEA